MPENQKPLSPGEKLQVAAQRDQFVSFETVKSHLQRDVGDMYILLAEIMSSDEIITAIANVIYKRYQDIMKAKEAQPELDLNENK